MYHNIWYILYHIDWIKLGNDANDKIKRQGKKIKDFGKTQQKLKKNIKEGNRRAERLIFYNFMKKIHLR